MSLLNALKSKMWLVQRVRMPKNYVNPFGVASASVQQQFKDIFEVEYMGAAEYEHGRLDQYMNKMIDNAQCLKVYGHNVRYRDIAPWKLNKYSSELFMKGEIDSTLVKIYIVCINIGHDGVENHDAFYKAMMGINYLFTEAMTTEGDVSKNDNGSYYARAINKQPRGDTIGWIPLKSDFAWFTDKNMANEFVKRLRELKREGVLDEQA